MQLFFAYFRLDPADIMSKFFGEVPILIANVSTSFSSGQRVNVTGLPLCWFIILYFPKFPVPRPKFIDNRQNAMLLFKDRIHVSIRLAMYISSSAILMYLKMLCR